MVEGKSGGFFRTSFLSQTFLTYRGRKNFKSDFTELEETWRDNKQNKTLNGRRK